MAALSGRNRKTTVNVIPAKAGIQTSSRRKSGTSKALDPAPVYTGVTRRRDGFYEFVNS